MAYTTINKSTDYFNTVLYTGTEPSNKAVTGVGFQPDFTWIKQRSGTEGHYLADVLRGSTKVLRSNETDIENDRGSNGIQSFDSDGFTAGGGDDINSNGGTFASWNWKANGAGSANTDGTINSTVSVNSTAGFSIVAYTGTATSGVTVGHGLGVKPNMIIIKNREPATANWQVYHSSLGATKYVSLNSTNASSTSASRWNNTEPTSSVFTLGSSGDVVGDNSGETFIAYCFAEKTGYSKFGSYVGNGNSDGTFVYTGFKPSLIIQKNSGATGNWILYDNKRDVDNVADKILIPNSSSAEATACDVDLLSNGFKFRAVNDASSNKSGNAYVYMAFAEAPLVGSNNVPCTAR